MPAMLHRIGVLDAGVASPRIPTEHLTIARVMERAVQKYGPQDWTEWEFRAEPVPKTSGAATVRFA